jgi:hypothetical protein
MLGIAAVILVLISCSTPQTRISDHPNLYQGLSSRDQALVSQGQIRSGMSRSAVWLAWGSPDQRIVGNMAGTPTETWIYIYYATYPYYPYYGAGPWGPWASNDSGPGYSLGYTGVGVAGGRAGVGVAGGNIRRSDIRVFRQPLLRPILLVVYPAQYPLSWQGGHIRQQQGYVLPIPGTELEGIKNSGAFHLCMNQYRKIPNQWLTCIFEISSTFLNVRAN